MSCSACLLGDTLESNDDSYSRPLFYVPASCFLTATTRHVHAAECNAAAAPPPLLVAAGDVVVMGGPGSVQRKVAPLDATMLDVYQGAQARIYYC
jgi:hypothetical protein